MSSRNSFSFRAWIGLIWEISAPKARQNAAFFGARLFCQNTKMSGFNDMRNIKGFSGYSFWKMFLSKYVHNAYTYTYAYTYTNTYTLHGPRPGRRPPSRPEAHVRCMYLYMYMHMYMYLLWIEIQYFQDPGSLECLEIQYFQDPGFLKWIEIQYFQDPRSFKWLEIQYFQDLGF